MYVCRNVKLCAKQFTGNVKLCKMSFPETYINISTGMVKAARLLTVFKHKSIVIVIFDSYFFYFSLQTNR